MAGVEGGGPKNAFPIRQHTQCPEMTFRLVSTTKAPWQDEQWDNGSFFFKTPHHQVQGGTLRDLTSGQWPHCSVGCCICEWESPDCTLSVRTHNYKSIQFEPPSLQPGIHHFSVPSAHSKMWMRLLYVVLHLLRHITAHEFSWVKQAACLPSISSISHKKNTQANKQTKKHFLLNI